LAQAGYEVVCASNGAAALALARERPPILVLSDVAAPAMDGVTLCRALKHGAVTRGVPVVLITDAAHKLFGVSGADTFVSQPLDNDALLAVVARYARATG
jgi:CheY-like chemotaxis protein